ncbi:Mcm10/DnaG-type zinc finger protein [Aspergillus mulundensis]|uniref:Uncharacterized protein n=1 Tax=Aspergillus mulundensis TaxID=1810919 RepID=A0A3D8SKS8_9EURO|nr:hypothetical protein DSM5745_03040 [Aspergillus mulundensis]RDW86398.1 hypothetical protein DSM5745_03040 [Aspergillus mulundensis]
MQRNRTLLASPLKHSAAAPNSRSRATQLLEDGLNEDEGDDTEEDEETLQLKLAAIQARLKLKQLQKSRGKAGTPNRDRNEGADALSRPASSVSFSSFTEGQLSKPKASRETSSRDCSDDIQVPLSPTRRPGPPVESTSPGRYRLGIDKGLKGSDVSLKRPPSFKAADARPTSRLGSRDGPATHQRHTLAPQSLSFEEPRPKSFSERMAEGRAAEKSRREQVAKAEHIRANRSSAFQYDKAEMEAFKGAAAEKRPECPSKLRTRNEPTDSFSRNDVLRSVNNLKPSLKRSKTTSSLRENEPRSYLQRRSQRSEAQSFSSQPESSRPNSFTDDASTLAERAHEKPDAAKFEPFSTLHLSNRILPHSFMTRTLEGKKALRIPDLLRMIKGPPFELPDEIDTDYVVFGIVASKSEPKRVRQPKNTTAQAANPFDDGLNNRDQYMAITLTDLKWTIDLFLFDTAFPRYYRLSEGTLIAILNPTILPPPKDKLDTNRFSLSLSSSDDMVLEVGSARDIGYCKAVRKDGKTCQAWVDGRKTEFCDFHVDLQLRRAQAGRMGVNSGAGIRPVGSRSGFYGGQKRSIQKGSGEGLLRADGAQYDRETQSLYYVAPSSKSRSNTGSSFHHLHPGQSAASLIDADTDDPFIAAGMLGRGAENKGERFRRRLVEKQKEREITQMITSRTGGVAGDYLRAQIKNNENAPTTNSARSAAQHKRTNSKDPKSHAGSFVDDKPLAMSFKRAEAVRLSPKKRAHDGDRPHGSGIKKTRFITSNGIKEAGRDSLGGISNTTPQTDDYDDDDDLEIV